MRSKLFCIRCDNCGSEYRISSRGEMNCAFCGSKIYLNDKDFEEYQKVRDEMLMLDKTENDNVNNQGDYLNLWNNECNVTFEAPNGQMISCDYVYMYKKSSKTIYVCRNKIVVIYNRPADYNKVVDNLGSIVYPSADIKNMSKYFPTIVMNIDLKDGRILVVYEKFENIYPIEILSGIDAKSVAWMISRMENIGCLLNFNDFDFYEMSITDFYFNPKTHEVFLFDGLENLYRNSQCPVANYLRKIREFAKEIMDESSAPQKCMDFLNNEATKDAYTDFNNWDDVIMTGFNGHNYHKFIL